MSTETLLVTPETLPDYLTTHGLIGPGEPVAVRELGGGVSNIVLLIELPGRRWVLKQSLEKLRVKDDWRSDRGRVYREADSLKALGPCLGQGVVPEVVHVDLQNFLFIMTAAPQGSAVWKESLLAGQVDLGVARQAGALLAKMINASRSDPDLRKRFNDRTVFDQLRIDPYYRTTAQRHPDVRGPLVELMVESWNIRSALVHGDYSPKNILVHDGRVFLIDFEVIHWGDPAFDAAFLLNHLFLKAQYRPDLAALYMEAVREFWKALGATLEGGMRRGFEALTVRHLGGLMLARIDGKSPVEYIGDEETKERVRQFSKQILRERPQRLEAVVESVLERTSEL